ncbi:MAG: hypothetical protein CMI60_12715 [Parvibaculum sp.]|jgi:hypothetical protein|nr:hypothetical protein [Parvibaculum sp.]
MVKIQETLRTPGPLRNLLLLAAVTLFFVVAAAVALSTQREATSVRFDPVLFFPDLNEKVGQATRLVYTTGQGMQGTANITIERDDEGIWRVLEREGYPARVDRVRKTILGLTELEAFEPRTSNPEWHRNLGLLEPENLGRAVRVQLLDKDGNEIAGLLAGEIVESTADLQGRGFLYVRRDGEDQTWLARGSISLDKEVSNWLDTNVVDLPLERIHKVTLWEGSENPVVLSRLKPEHPNFIIENVPSGSVSRGAPIVNASATAFAGFEFQDAVPVESIIFNNPPVATIETFNGLKLTLTMTGAGSGMWSKIVASVAPSRLEEGADKSALEAEVAEINSRIGDWAYKLEQNVGLRLTQTMGELTRPVVDGTTVP